jgi:hypothetical protein
MAKWLYSAAAVPAAAAAAGCGTRLSSPDLHHANSKQRVEQLLKRPIADVQVSQPCTDGQINYQVTPPPGMSPVGHLRGIRRPPTEGVLTPRQSSGKQAGSSRAVIRGRAGSSNNVNSTAAAAAAAAANPSLNNF